MLITFEDGSAFAQGAAGYNTVPGYELSEHIILTIEIGAGVSLNEAVVDTSSPYLILNSAVARNAGFDLERPDQRGKARVQGQLLEGSLFSITLSLLADEDSGDTLQVDGVWAFVPDGTFDPDPLPPTLIGFSRCLDNFLFAVDPNQQMFYFG